MNPRPSGRADLEIGAPIESETALKACGVSYGSPAIMCWLRDATAASSAGRDEAGQS
jgi:hypothetical protein